MPINALALIGGSNIKTSGDIAESIESVNELLYNIGTYAGAILIALAVIKIILSMQDSNPNAKAQASLMLGGGIIAISFSTIMAQLDVANPNMTAKILTRRAMYMIGSAMTFVGVILVVLAIYQFIMSFLNEQSEEKASASRLLGTGIAFMAGSSITTQITDVILKSSDVNQVTQSVVSVVISIIGNASTYIGVGLLIYGIFHLITAFRNEEVESKYKAGITIGVAIALMSMNLIFDAIFY